MKDVDDMPQLSDSTLAALKDFYAEQDTQQKRFEDLRTAAENNARLSMDMFSEDWNASQFWYSDDTATTLAQQLLEGLTADTSIAVVSAPSVFIQLKNLLLSEEYPTQPHVRLLEYDDRFSVLPEFIHYDFKSPLHLPAETKGRFDRIICDPPFLSDECQTKAAITVRWLSKASSKIMVCTGERMESLIHKVYPGTRTTSFEPQHAQGRLSNEFRCYANFECDAWSWR